MILNQIQNGGDAEDQSDFTSDLCFFFNASIARRSDLSVSFINIRPGPGSQVHLNPQMRETGRRIRIGPESHRSRSDRSRNRNPLKIRTRNLLYSCTNPVLLFARVLDTHPALAHILMWVCGSAACTRTEGVCVCSRKMKTHTHTIRCTLCRTAGVFYLHQCESASRYG